MRRRQRPYEGTKPALVWRFGRSPRLRGAPRPRLDILCRDRDGSPLAYAWVEPAGGTRWIGVDQGPYAELYEVLGAFPVRISSPRGIDREDSRATFAITQYDGAGNALFTGKLEARVAG